MRSVVHEIIYSIHAVKITCVAFITVVIVLCTVCKVMAILAISKCYCVHKCDVMCDSNSMPNT